MSRKLQLALLGACVGLASFVSLKIIKAPPVKKVVIKRLNPIVRLVYSDRTFCTGTVVDMNTIVTAAHCVVQYNIFGGATLSKEPIEIRAEDNKPRNIFAVALNASSQMDTAVLRGNFIAFEPKSLQTDPSSLTGLKVKGSAFVSCGYPLYGELYCNVTTFESVDNFHWAVKGTLLPGMSGGPTMLPDGTVIAINSAVNGANSLVAPTYNVNSMFDRDRQ